ncbi:MAG: putative metalloprotease CJM1_0395 family protein, partial [Candidatus Latescibacterota bacterium]|nr:putative metalloprotease CJM1_0395 family protein [Candidatus Latescibacterota bacterium]
ATIRKAQQIYRAALAPAEPSSQDRSVASQAKKMEMEARSELREQQDEEGDTRRGGLCRRRGHTCRSGTIGRSRIHRSTRLQSFVGLRTQRWFRRVACLSARFFVIWLFAQHAGTSGSSRLSTEHGFVCL